MPCHRSPPFFRPSSPVLRPPYVVTTPQRWDNPRKRRAVSGCASVLRRRDRDAGPPQERNAPCTNRQICARGVFRSQTAGPDIKALPLFRFIRAKTRENGAFYGSRPAGNAGKSIGFRALDRQTGIERAESPRCFLTARSRRCTI